MIRVLHVLGRLDFGGVESWLAQVAANIDRSKVQLDFLVHDTRPGALDESVRAQGCRILPCALGNPVTFSVQLLRTLRRYGPYDVVHSHVHHFSGAILLAARLAGVRVRLAHSHSDTRRGDATANWRRRAYLRATERLVRRHATAGLAASRDAASALFGSEWASDSRLRVLHCGIDLSRYHGTSASAEVRKELGIGESTLVLGHVGRLSPPKNHRFLLEVMAAFVRSEPESKLVLVGDGPLRSAIRQGISDFGLDGKVLLCGARSDVPRLLAAMDVFVFPSLWEGMPLSLVEAQAAGLPCLVSDAVTTEATVVKELVTRLGLPLGAGPWADTATRLARAPRPVDAAAALARVRASDFDISTSTHALEALYGA